MTTTSEAWVAARREEKENWRPPEETLREIVVDWLEDHVPGFWRLTVKRPRMRPSHPGGSLADWVLDQSARSIELEADRMGMSVRELMRLIAGIDDITPAIAVRLEDGYGSSAELWCRLQAHYDRSVGYSTVPTDEEIKTACVEARQAYGPRRFPKRRLSPAHAHGCGKPVRVDDLDQIWCCGCNAAHWPDTMCCRDSTIAGWTT